MMEVVHIITGLNNGGAEGVLYRLCKYDNKFKHIVISMIDEGKYGPLLRELGVEVYCLNMPVGKLTLSGLWKLFRLIRFSNPYAVQTWMYHADLIGGVVAKFSRVKNIFWNVRHTTLDPRNSKQSTILIAKVCAILSALIPKKIIYCAHEAKAVHEVIGYKIGKGIVIGNGYDLSQFYPYDVVNAQQFSDLENNSSDFIIGLVGRLAPEKDHLNLFNALSIVKSKIVHFHCFLVGRGLEATNSELVTLLQEIGLDKQVSLLGQSSDIPEVLNCLDLHALSSSSEGFPNVLAEAMACGTPCVTTDVGDAALIVGKTGWVVPSKDPQALAEAIIKAMQEKQGNNQAWLNRKKACRNRIIDNYSIDQMVKNYHQAWKTKE